MCTESRDVPAAAAHSQCEPCGMSPLLAAVAKVLSHCLSNPEVRHAHCSFTDKSGAVGCRYRCRDDPLKIIGRRTHLSVYWGGFLSETSSGWLQWSRLGLPASLHEVLLSL
jgi:hypothetical protein